MNTLDLGGAVARSEALFRTLVQSSWDVFHLVAPDGTILYESPAVSRVLGYQPEEMVGHSVLEFLHPDDANVSPASLPDPGAPRCVILRVLHKNGSWRWIESFEVNLLEHPDVRAIAVNYRDITDRKLVEFALVESNRALQLLLLCNQAVIRSESESELLQATCRAAVESGAFCMAWVGYAMHDELRRVVPQAQAGGEGYLSHIDVSWSDNHPNSRGPAGTAVREGRAVVMPDFRQEASFQPWVQLAGSHGFQGVVCLPLKDQQQTFGVLALYLSEVRAPLPNELQLLQELADNLAYGVLTLRARSERRHAQHKLAEQAALLDNATDAIVVRDLQERVTYWNKSAERVYGWTAAEAVGQSVLHLLHKESEWPAFEAASRCMGETGEWTGECRKIHRSGRTIVVQARWTLVRDEQGHAHSILSINTDISERKALEEQFLRAQRMESIGTLAGGIAHDLNNVLAPILLSLDLLKMQCSDEDSLDLVSVLESSARHGAVMVGQLLSFSRGAEGAKLQVQVDHLLQDVAKIASETFSKKIEVRTRIPEDLWCLRGDRTQLHQVLLNLCVNARDAMPQGGILTLSGENVNLDAQYSAANLEATPGPYLSLQVEDTGVGISAGVLEKVFDPFFTTKELGKGTGLGLSTAMGIVKSHGGFLRVYSEPGSGTKFMIYLPADIGAVQTGETAPVRLPRGNGQLILVVDDEPSVRTVTRQTLEAFGYRVVLASDGAEAIAVFAQRGGEIAAVLTDMMMPILEGLPTIRVLRRLSPSLPIIAASGLDGNAELAQLGNLGVKHFLSKPYTADKLLIALEEALAAQP